MGAYQEEINELKGFVPFKRLNQMETDLKSDVSIYMKRSLSGGDKVELRRLLLEANEVLQLIKQKRRNSR